MDFIFKKKTTSHKRTDFDRYFIFVQVMNDTEELVCAIVDFVELYKNYYHLPQTCDAYRYLNLQRQLLLSNSVTAKKKFETLQSFELENTDYQKFLEIFTDPRRKMPKAKLTME